MVKVITYTSRYKNRKKCRALKSCKLENRTPGTGTYKYGHRKVYIGSRGAAYVVTPTNKRYYPRGMNPKRAGPKNKPKGYSNRPKPPVAASSLLQKHGLAKPLRKGLVSYRKNPHASVFNKMIQ